MSSLDAQAQAPTMEAPGLGVTRTVAVATAAAVALICLLRHGLGVDVLFGTAFVAVLAAVSVVDFGYALGEGQVQAQARHRPPAATARRTPRTTRSG
jgi:hypothetical protein